MSGQLWLVPLFSTLLGACVAGVIAHLNARHFAKEQSRKEVERERRSEATRNLGLAHSIVFKVQRATDMITKVHKHFVSARQIAAKNAWPLWQGMKEFFGTDRLHVAFDADELGLFVVKDRADFTNNLQDVASAHNLLVDLIHAYNSQRNEFSKQSTSKNLVALAGEVASFESSDPNVVLLALRLEQLAQAIGETSEGAVREALELSASVTTLLSEILSDPRFKMRIAPPVIG
ncbi:MAG: hypothetical protein WDM79_07915 [Terricaulis sp.]